MAKGFTTKMEFIIGVPAVGQEVAQAISGYLSKVGITADLQGIDNATLGQQWFGGGRAPMFPQPATYDPAMDGDLVYAWYWSKQPPPARRWVNPEFDQVFEASRAEKDTTKREQLLKQQATILHDQAPMLYVVQFNVLVAMDKKVVFEPGPGNA